jgi:hypothetical protein
MILLIVKEKKKKKKTAIFSSQTSPTKKNVIQEIKIRWKICDISFIFELKSQL